PPMFDLVVACARVADTIFDRVLVAQPVRTLDGIVHVPAPVVRMHVAERRRDAALRCHGMRAGRKYFCDAGGAQAGLAAADHRAQARAAGADHDDVVGVVLDWIGLSVGGGSTTAVCGPAVAISGHALNSG